VSSCCKDIIDRIVVIKIKARNLYDFYDKIKEVASSVFDLIIISSNILKENSHFVQLFLFLMVHPVG